MGRAIDAASKHAGPGDSVEYSPDGRFIAVSCKQNAVFLWDSETGLSVGPPLLHVGEVLAIHFSPDSRELITVSGTGEVRRWPIAQHLQIRQTCLISGFTP